MASTNNSTTNNNSCYHKESAATIPSRNNSARRFGAMSNNVHAFMHENSLPSCNEAETSENGNATPLTRMTGGLSNQTTLSADNKKANSASALLNATSGRSLRDIEESRSENELSDETDQFLVDSARERPRKFRFFPSPGNDATASSSSALEEKTKENLATKKSFKTRLVDKNGTCLIRPKHVPDQYFMVYRNWFHLLIEISWRSVLLLFSAGFLGSWLFFGFLYYLIVQYSDIYQVRRSEDHKCIANVDSFVSAFLFSMESQHTIGYGVRYMTEICPAAFMVLCVQLIIGVLLQTILAGIVIAKVLRPKKRKQEMRFSNYAVISWPMDDETTADSVLPLSDTSADQLSVSSLIEKFETAKKRQPQADNISNSSGSSKSSTDNSDKPVLMIRLADVQHRLYLAESHVRLYMATTKINREGNKELIGLKDMNVGYDNGTDRVLLLWPILIRHIIDEDSPFYDMTPEKAKTVDFELIMTIEGIVEATGMTFQARTSFLPNEVKWGERFVPIVVMNPKTKNFEVDYSLFDVTKPCELPPGFGEEQSMDPSRKKDRRQSGTNKKCDSAFAVTEPPQQQLAAIAETVNELSSLMTLEDEEQQHRAVLHDRKKSCSMASVPHTTTSSRRSTMTSSALPTNDRKGSVAESVFRSVAGEAILDSYAHLERGESTDQQDSLHQSSTNRRRVSELLTSDDDAGGILGCEDENDEEYCRGGDANLTEFDTDGNDDGGERPLLVSHQFPSASIGSGASGGGATGGHHHRHQNHHHKFHQRNRHHSSSGFT